MLLSAIQKFTLLDYPEKVACIAFTPGCNFRCGYCHNPEFVLPEMLRDLKESFIPEEVFFRFLQKRQGKLEGVVVTGGEPTLLGDLIPFLKRIKDLGFLIKLDTNGNKPDVLDQALTQGLVDYVAMDIKTSLGQYKHLVGDRASETSLSQSIHLLQSSIIEYEFRTTLIKEIHSKEILEAMATLLEGSNKLYLQTFRPGHTLNPVFQSYHPFSEIEMEEIQNFFQKFVKVVALRN